MCKRSSTYGIIHQIGNILSDKGVPMNEEETQQAIDQVNEDFVNAIWEALAAGLTNEEILTEFAGAIKYVSEMRTSD